MINAKLLVAVVLISGILSSGCLKDKCTETRTFVRFDPVYRSQSQLDESVSVSAARQLKRPGIIYFYKNYILINEFREGIHVINNTDPTNPVNEAFLDLEGNEHFAVLNNQLQANKFNALLTIDISDIQNPVEKSRVRNVFENVWEDPGRGFLVYYRESEQSNVLDCSEPNFNSLRWSDSGGNWWLLEDAFGGIAVPSVRVDQSGNNQGPGTGGSTARFTITANHLYIVSEYNMKVFDLANASSPALRNTINLGWGIETIYPFKDKLFIGSNAGMHVYDVSTPAEPLFQSTFEHARACDPVVADDHTAYVTLRDGTTCEGFENQLDVIDVENILSPRLLNSYAMKNPHGLALSGDILYICEGDYGFKVVDVSDRDQVKEMNFQTKIKSNDVIALPNDHLLVIGDEGLMQFDAKDPKHLKQMSTIPVMKGE